MVTDANTDETINEAVMDVYPIVVEGIPYVPVRAVAEAYRYTVGWEQATHTVTIVA